MPVQTPPVMSVAFLQPVLDVLEAQGETPDDLARQLKLAPDQLRLPTVMVPAERVYDFLEWASSCMGDPGFCARVGRMMARGGWAPVNPMMAKCRTVCEFLLGFGMAAQGQGGAATYRLEVEGSTTQWKLRRPPGTAGSARFADAIAVAFFSDLLLGAEGAEVRVDDLVVVTSDPGLIPEDILPAANIIGGAIEMTLRFPTLWLQNALAPLASQPDLPVQQIPSSGLADLATRVRNLIAQNLPNPDYGIDEIAEEIGLPRWKLQRALRGSGLTVAALRREVRFSHACEALLDSDRTVAEIAESLGYTSASNFSRAFRAGSGQSPGEFRRAGKPMS